MVQHILGTHFNRDKGEKIGVDIRLAAGCRRLMKLVHHFKTPIDIFLIVMEGIKSSPLQLDHQQHIESFAVDRIGIGGVELTI